jgi:hypothetical protein
VFSWLQKDLIVWEEAYEQLLAPAESNAEALLLRIARLSEPYLTLKPFHKKCDGVDDGKLMCVLARVRVRVRVCACVHV